MKRTFIPPSHRPYVVGSTIEKEDSSTAHYLEIFSDKRKRRQLIIELLRGDRTIPGHEKELLQKTMAGFFPQLKKGEN